MRLWQTDFGRRCNFPSWVRAGNAESCATICELARLLAYDANKTKMLVGQWRQDLVGLERKLQSELDEGPQIPSPDNGGGRHSRRHNGANG